MIKKILISVGIFLGLLVVADVALVWGIAHVRPEIKHADAVMILGAAINTPALTNRTMEGLGLYEQDNVDVMVLSGGKISDADISEAQYMEKVIKKNAKEKVDYILEQDSHNTYENIKNSKAKLVEEGKAHDSIIIVSDAFHLARGVLMAKRAGFDDVYWSAPSSGYYRRGELRFYYWREFVAMLNYIPKFITG